MVKKVFTSLLVSIIIALPLCLSCSAEEQGYLLNYPIYDTSTLTSATPTLLAPYGVFVKSTNLSITVRNGMIGASKTTFNTAVNNGTIVLVSDPDVVQPYPEDGTLITPPIYNANNSEQVLAPYGVAIKQSNTAYVLVIRSNGIWTCNPTNFANYSAHNFIVLTEPETEPEEPTNPEEPTEPTQPDDTEHPDYTNHVRYSLVMGFSLYCIASLIGYAIYKSVHLINI